MFATDLDTQYKAMKKLPISEGRKPAKARLELDLRNLLLL